MKVKSLVKAGNTFRSVSGVKILKSKTSVVIEKVTAGSKVIKQWRRVNCLISGSANTIYTTSVRLPMNIKSGKLIDKCTVFCTCDDFKFTFYKKLVEEGLTCALIPASEFPESKGAGRHRAIDQIGVCKHVLALLESEVFEGKMYAD